METAGYADATGLRLLQAEALPLACAATCRASIDVQRMMLEAGIRGDVTLLKQAMLHDPLSAAVCTPEEIWQMADRMLVALGAHLPQFAAAIPEAERRIAEGPDLRRENAGEGAYRRPVRSPEELRRERQNKAILSEG